MPDDPRLAAPVGWRRVLAPGAPPPPAAVEMSSELRGQLAEIERVCEERVREARAAGAREGETEGRARAAAELQPVLDRLARSIDDLAQFRPWLRREAEADTVKLAIAIARRILRREMAVDPDALRGLVHAALEKLEGQEVSRVRVHPAHAPLVGACLRELGAAVEVAADPSRDLGSVIFETGRGNLDGSVETQLQEIERGLADRLRRANR